MELQRKVRKHAEYMASLKRLGATLGPILFAAIATLAWRNVSNLTFTIFMVIVVFGLLLCNPGNLRNYIPGHNSARPIVRALLVMLYLSIVFAILSLAGS